MARVIVLGAGTGGMAGAYEIREAIGSEHQVTVINEREDFQFVPSNPWIAVGWRERPDTSFPIRPYLEKKNIEFISAAVTAIDPKQNSLTLADGRVENYDYLVIATGPKLNFAAIEGAGPHGGHTQSICALDHAETGQKTLAPLPQRGSPVIDGGAVIGQHQRQIEPATRQLGQTGVVQLDQRHLAGLGQSTATIQQLLRHTQPGGMVQPRTRTQTTDQMAMQLGRLTHRAHVAADLRITIKIKHCRHQGHKHTPDC